MEQLGTEEKKEEMKLEVESIDNVEIFETGNWKGKAFTEKDIDEAINNFKEKVAEPYITLDHNPGLTKLVQDFFKTTGLGYVSDLWRIGNKLMANFKQVPKLIADLINAGTMKKRSVEWWRKFNHSNGKTFNNVLEAVTFHGGNGLPAISTLAEIPALFKGYEIDATTKSGDLVSIELSEFKKEEVNRMEITITKEEYMELLKAKNECERLTLELKAKDDSYTQLKTDLDKISVEKESLVKLKKEIDDRSAKIDRDEANSVIDGLIKEVKVKPVYKDMYVERYVELKKSGNDTGLELFKKELSDRDEIVSTKTILKNGETGKFEFKSPEYNTEAEVEVNIAADRDRLDKTIQLLMKTDGIDYVAAAKKLGVGGV